MADLITNKNVVRAKKALSEAFLQLIRKKSYEKIAVTDICKKADVVRKTFYNHFGTKDDIVRYLFRIMFEELEKKATINSLNLNKWLSVFYNFIMEYRDFLLLFHKRGLIRFANECISEYVEKQEIVLIYSQMFVSPKTYKYIADYVSAVLVSVVETWIKNHFSEPVEFLVEITESFFSNHLINPTSIK